MQNGHRPLGIRYAHDNALDLIRYSALEMLDFYKLKPNTVLGVVGYPHPSFSDNGKRKFSMTTIIILDRTKVRETGKFYIHPHATRVGIKANANYKVIESGDAHKRLPGGGSSSFSTNMWPEEEELQSELKTGGRPLYMLDTESLFTSPA